MRNLSWRGLTKGEATTQMRRHAPAPLVAFAALFLAGACAHAQLLPSSTNLNVSPGPSTFGSPVALVATVTGAAATGTVSFYDGTNILETEPLSSGTATVTTIVLSSGKHSLTARYSGDTVYMPSTSAPVAQTVNSTPATTFTSVTPVSVGAQPVSAVIADFNGDGKADLAVVNQTSGTVSILLGNGNGTFAAAVNYSVGTTPTSIALGDFNNDGKLDLAVANMGSNNVSILLGNGDGTFSAATTPANLNAISNADYVVVGDFNHDGNADLAIANGTGTTVSIALGNGDGTFGAVSTFAVGNNPVAIATNDFNGDGIPDLAVVNENDGTVSILLGNGNGTFGAATNYNVGSSPNSIAVADFNGDGNPDLAVGNFNSNNVSILLNGGTGTFSNAPNSPIGVGTSPLSVAVGDFNGDGSPDLAVVGSGSTSVFILLNNANGTGTFGAPSSYSTGAAPLWVSVGDFNGDGRADLAIPNTNGAVSLLLGAGPANTIAATAGASQSATIGTMFGTALQVTVTDSSGNPVPGVTVTFTAPSSGASAILSSGTATTNNAGMASVTATANTIAGGPYNVTATVAGVTGSATFMLTNTIGPPQTVAPTAGTTPQSTAINTQFGTALQVLVTDAGGNPVPNVTVNYSAPASGASATLSSATATTNNAGIASVTATANGATGTYNVVASVAGATTQATFVLTNTSGTLSVTLSSSANPSTFGSSVMLMATLSSTNATGKVTFYDGPIVLGVQTVSNGSASISTILLSPGQHSLTAYYSGDSNYSSAVSAALPQTVNTVAATTFVAAVTPTVGSTPIFIALGDFNNDGKADLAVVNAGSNNVSVLLGNGDGTFASAVNYAVGSNPSSVVVGDFNGDGNADLAVVNAGSNSVSILLGNGTGTFTAGPNCPNCSLSATPVAIAAADFNGDGKVDLAITTNNGVMVLPGNGDGTFGAAINSGAGLSLGAIAIGDFNLDGKADVAVANGSTVTIFLGNGNGTFNMGASYATGSPDGIAVGDFNGNGKPDLAVTDLNGNDVSILLGNGDGTFTGPVTYTVGSGPYSPQIGDFNGDGILDLAVANSQSGNVSVLLGNGDGTFGSAMNYAVGSGPDSLVVGDFNGDGKADLAVANAGSGNVSILLGAGPPSSIAATSGNSQSAMINTTFGIPMQATVTDSEGNALAGVSVTFTAPASGPSGTFSTGGITATVQTNASGIATAPAFTANGITGTYNVVATIPNVNVVATFALNNIPPGLAITTASLPSATIGTGYSATLAAQGGTPPYTWSIVSGALPAGLSLNASTGVISGTPTGPVGTASFTVQVTDSSSPAQAVSENLSIVVGAPPPVITTSTLPTGVAGSAYSATLSAQSGLAPYSWSVSSGTLPPGLTLTAAGAITGTPTTSATYTFTVKVRDSSATPQTATKSLTIAVNPVVSISLAADTSTQQPGVTVSNGTIQSAEPAQTAITGTISLSFNPNAANLPTPYTNPGVCFSSSSCANPPVITASFTIPAGSSSVAIPALQTGTVAGQIVLTLSVSGQATTSSTITVPQIAPVIEANSVQIMDVTATGFVVELVANSTPRDVQSVTFAFSAAPGATLNGTTTFTVNVSSVLSSWYSTSQGQGYGSAFSLTVPFTLSGDASAIGSVSVTLTNSVGTSAAVSGTQ